MKKVGVIIAVLAGICAIAYFAMQQKQIARSVSHESQETNQNVKEDTSSSQATAAKSTSEAEETLGIFKKDDEKHPPTDVEKKKHELVSSYVLESGTSAEFLSLHKVVDAQMNEIRELDISDEEKKKFGEIFSEIFDGKKLLDTYMHKLNDAMSIEELEELNASNKGPIAESINSKMNHLQSEQGKADFTKYIKSMNGQAIPQKRYELLKSLDSLTGESKIATDLAHQIMGLTAKLSGAGKDLKLSSLQKEQKKKADEKASKDFDAYIKKGTMFRLSYTHAGLSDKDISDRIAKKGLPSSKKELEIRQNLMEKLVDVDHYKHELSTLIDLHHQHGVHQ